MSTYLIALGLSLVGGLGGLLVASGVLLFNDSARARLVPWLVSYAVGALLGVSTLAILPSALEQLPAHVCSERCCSASCSSSSSKSSCSGGTVTRTTARCTTAPFCRSLSVMPSTISSMVLSWPLRFLTSVPLGISTALAVAAHEIPQEVGDFAILLHAGYSRRGVAAERALGRRQRPGAIARCISFDSFPNAALLSRPRRRQLPVRRDGRPHSRTPPGRTDAGSMRQILLIGAGIASMLVLE